MDTDTSEIKALKRIVWRSALSSRVERFAAILDDPEAKKHFDEEFVAQLSTKIDRLFRTLLIISVLYSILMLSLLAAQEPSKSEFQILGYSFKNLAYFKEFLLFAAVSLSPISAAISAYHRYLSELRTKALGVLFPNPDVREFAKHIYTDGYADPLLKDHRAPHVIPHGVTAFLLVMFGVVLIGLLVALIVASFILQVAVVHDVATKPSSSPYINLFVVAYSLSAIALSWLIGILRLPLPEVNVDAYTRLSVLRENDEAKYKETMARLAADSARRERAWSVGTSVAIFFLVYSAAVVIFFPDSLQRVGPLLTRSILGTALAFFVATSVTSRIKRAIYRRYFRKYPEGSDEKLKAFARATKLVSIARLALTTVVSIGYSVAVLSNA